MKRLTHKATAQKKFDVSTKQQLPALLKKDEKAENLHKGCLQLPAGAGTGLTQDKLVFSTTTANTSETVVG